MKLFRTINSQFDPKPPLIQWESGVGEIIAALRAAQQPESSARHRSRVLSRLANARRAVRVTAVAPMEVAA